VDAYEPQSGSFERYRELGLSELNFVSSSTSDACPRDCMHVPYSTPIFNGRHAINRRYLPLRHALADKAPAETRLAVLVCNRPYPSHWVEGIFRAVKTRSTIARAVMRRLRLATSPKPGIEKRYQDCTQSSGVSSRRWGYGSHRGEHSFARYLMGLQIRARLSIYRVATWVVDRS
jgi:hypothetical protein